MEYADTVVRAVRLSVRNPFAILLVSVGVSVSLLPFVTGILVAGTLGAIVGLWTTSLLLGFVSVGGARITATVYERRVSIGTSYFWEGVREGWVMGLAIGIGTFFVSLFALLLSMNTLGGALGMSIIMFGVYALLAWYVLALFVLTVWGASDGPDGIEASFRQGGIVLVEHPIAGLWVLVQTIGWTLLSIPLIIAPILLLPGFVQLVATAIIRRAIENGEDES
ncbi:hypothetical protein [Halorhabdus amylolytica]|uniref:hypothetical protein n=1 Tax=Halorhabdus amylolytica TaxID=2559573 RepID=UPI0010A9F623|nr:hypothetical protein [Halorhabdus amylolytica]